MIFFYDKNGKVLASVEATPEIEKGFTMPETTPIVVPSEIVEKVHASKDPSIINNYQVANGQIVIKPADKKSAK